MLKWWSQGQYLPLDIFEPQQRNYIRISQEINIRMVENSHTKIETGNSDTK